MCRDAALHRVYTKFSQQELAQNDRGVRSPIKEGVAAKAIQRIVSERLAGEQERAVRQ